MSDMVEWTIRPERPGDAVPIAALTAAAFAGAEHSDGSEPAIIERLRTDGDLTLSLVAVLDAAEGADDAIIGHIALSPVTISDGTSGWYGLGPISAAPAHQGHGIGGALIEYALAQLRAYGAGGVVLLGDPAYYHRFGFAHDPALSYPGPPPEYFQRLILSGTPPNGIVQYARGFG